MTAAQRRWLLVPALAVMLGGLLWGMGDLRDFGHYAGPYGDVINKVAPLERQTDNSVAATVFDYRGLDTMGEEFILFAAVLGVVLLLRHQGERAESEEDRTGSDALRVFGLLMLGPALVVGLWLVAFGYITPGGGFQGGVVVAGAVMIVYLAWSHRALRRAAKEQVADVLEATGGGAYVGVGLAALIAGMPFLHNLMGTGTRGSLNSAGSIGVLNVATALEVAAALVVLFSEFLTSYIAPLVESGKERDQ